MLKTPPKKSKGLQSVIKDVPHDEVNALLQRYMKYSTPLDEKGRYDFYHDFFYRVEKGLDPDVCWEIKRQARTRQSNYAITIGDSARCTVYLTPKMYAVMSLCDRTATDAALKWKLNQIGEEKHFEYLFNDLVEDEAISSSQLEGAATTTKAAKSLLKRHYKPRSVDDRMIIGNFKMMNFAWNNRNEELSSDLLLEMHRIGVEGIEDVKYYPGAFRKNNDVYVANSDGDVVHMPPSAENIEKRIEKIVQWANKNHANTESRSYIHPMIKAIILHFAIGYEHPFCDGNGRVARSLFYWFMFKSGYAAFRYIAISKLLKSCAVKYGKSYIYTEKDKMDLTYFIDFQCEIIDRAITEFNDKYEQTVKENEEFNNWLYESGLYGKLNEKQRIVFQVARTGVSKNITSSEVMAGVDCSYGTASNVLNGLVKLNLFKRKKSGRFWVYNVLPSKTIMNKWSDNERLVNAFKTK
ncbi:Fic family protein [Shewanella sp.]|uniref:Fic family protein n=1 Tax=Shewanella sp. TaxID=50422 RepID=UPI003A978075